MHIPRCSWRERAQQRAGQLPRGEGAGENVGELGNLPRVLRHSIHVYPVHHYTETRAARCRPQSAPSDECKRRVSHTVAQRLRPPARRHHAHRAVCDPGARCPTFIAATGRRPCDSTQPRDCSPRTARTRIPAAPAQQPLIIPQSCIALHAGLRSHQSCPCNAHCSRPFFPPRPLRTFARSMRHRARGSSASLISPHCPI